MKKSGWMGRRLQKTGYVLILILIPVSFMFGSMFCGRYHVYPNEVFQSIMMAIGIHQYSISQEAYTVILQLRLPRIIAAAAVGAALAASGSAYQGVFRNPLVNSGMLGVSNGAGFGAALSIVLFGTAVYTYPFAFLFGISAVLLSYWIAGIYRTVPSIMLVLGGVIVSSIYSALLTLLKYVADVQNELPAIVYWLMGSVSSVTYRDFWALIPIALGIIVLFLFSWKINILSMGDKEAASMGISVMRCKCIIIAAATLSTAGAICLSGVVGWVGLVIPHIARMIIGNDNRKMLPVAVSVGAAFMVFIDTLSRSMITSEIPLGVLTAIVGAPFFIYLLKKTKGGGWNL